MTRRTFLAAAAASAAVGLGACSRSNAALEPVVGSVVTRWDTDPWSLGSYSALPPGSSWRVRQVLARTVIADRIVLAGEYCALDYPATVHGAYGSGARAARRLHQVRRRAGRAIVVGAGLAGLAAAGYLRNSGWSVEGGEARDRVGGRIHTDRSLAIPVERGASWIHGVTGNPMVRIVKQAGLRLIPTNYDDTVAHDYRTGRTVPAVVGAESQLWQRMGRISSRRPPAGRSVATALARQGWRADTPERRLAEYSEIALEFGLEADRLGAQALWEGKYSRGGDSLVAGGFQAVPEYLAADLLVRPQTAVRAIRPSRSGVVVDTDDGRLTADAVVVAVPLALLQAGIPSLRLPAAAADALASLVTGNLEKVFLSLDRVWWPSRQVLQVVNAPRGRWAEWYSMVPPFEQPIVMGLAGGRAATDRSRDDAVVVREALDTFRQAYR